MNGEERGDDDRRGPLLPLARHAAVLLLAGAAVAPCRADSQLQATPSRQGAISTSAHIDFRVTVPPSFGLSMQASGLRVQGNGGALTVQRSQRDAADGSSPSSHALLRPRHHVIDTTLPLSSLGRAELVTIASP